MVVASEYAGDIMVPANDIPGGDDAAARADAGAEIVRLFLAAPADKPSAHDFLDAMQRVERECYNRPDLTGLVSGLPAGVIAAPTETVAQEPGVHDPGVHDIGVHDPGVYDIGVHDIGLGAR